jgi:DNA polymerase-3 subunit gamma/tau
LGHPIFIYTLLLHRILRPPKIPAGFSGPPPILYTGVHIYTTMDQGFTFRKSVGHDGSLCGAGGHLFFIPPLGYTGNMAEEAGDTRRYEVTATRRRPKTFDELAGQDFVVATLKNSIESGSIAHAYLFSGPRGCGKTSAARILARSLNCEKGPTALPCGICSACREISGGTSLDVIEIDGASNNSVNDVRQIREEVLFPPHGGRYKVYIIDEVHMLSGSAFNALLKTIEEPPPYIVFIFATTELHKVPATIKSRCQQFAFRLIPLEIIQEILKATCAEAGIEAEDEALFWIAKESTGSLRDAYTLFDQVASFSEGRIRAALIREKLGLVGLDKLNALAETCAAGDAAGAFLLIHEILEAGIAIERLVIDLAGYYHSLLFLKAGITREAILGYRADRFSRIVLDKLDPIRLEWAVDLFLDLYRDIRYSVSPRFELETTVSKLCWLDQWISAPELKAAAEYAREALGIAETSRQIPAAPSPAGRRSTPADRVFSPGTGAGSAGTKEAGENADLGASLTEEFKRLMASRKSGPETEAVSGLPKNEKETAPQVETVLRLFRGTIVSSPGTPERGLP